MLVALFVFVAGCDKSNKSSTTKTTSANDTEKGHEVEKGHEAEPGGSPANAESPAPERLQPSVMWKDVGLKTPEAVLVDEDADVYLVSNIDGAPLLADNKGFLSKLSPDGKVAKLKWIEARKNGVRLNAPKGMAFRNGELFVADIDTVRIFDRSTGAPIGDVRIPGATFLNDVTLAPDGRVLVSDVGLKANKGALEPSGSDAVWAIDMERKAKPIVKKRLGGPNGLFATPGKIWVTALGSGELYSLDAKGNVGDVQKLPRGALASIVAVGDDVVVPSWESGEIFRGKLGGEFKSIIDDVRSPADLAYDRKRGRLLVPMLMDNELRAYDLK